MKSSNFFMSAIFILILTTTVYSQEQSRPETQQASSDLSADLLDSNPETSKIENLSDTKNNTPFLLKISMQDYVTLVKEKNEQVLVQELELKISQESVRNALSIFEPEVIGSYNYFKNKKQISDEEKQSLFSRDVRDETNHQYKTALEQLLPTGGRANLGYTLDNYYDRLIGSDEQYISFFGIDLTQPLLKSAGVDATRVKINLAETEESIIFQDYRKKLMQTAYDAAVVCYEYFEAVEKYKIQEQSVDIAEQILEDNIARVKFGKMARTEIWEAEAGLAFRKSLQSAAKQDIVSAMNRLLTLISSSPAETQIEIDVSETLNDDPGSDLVSSQLKAFKLRPEYLAALKKIEYENINLSFYKNQRLPQLDLNASYGLNGLDNSLDESWSEMFEHDYPTLTVGAQIKIPLGNMKTSSEFKSAQYKKRQAILEMKSIEVALKNFIDTAFQNVFYLNEQTREYAKASNLNKKLLEAELSLLNKGKSNSRLVLDKDKNLIIARLSEIESRVKEKNAILQLKMAEGSILEYFDIEIMDIAED